MIIVLLHKENQCEQRQSTQTKIFLLPSQVCSSLVQAVLSAWDAVDMQSCLLVNSRLRQSSAWRFILPKHLSRPILANSSLPHIQLLTCKKLFQSWLTSKRNGMLQFEIKLIRRKFRQAWAQASSIAWFSKSSMYNCLETSNSQRVSVWDLGGAESQMFRKAPY